ncbi:hypothetical protein V6N12_011478 [Hibiscus sabdariffa]|uniref:Uncharacterized protein n=1 Tax=Hibiscus sabdariffa TaxID=183260 RepID=A0ABR2BNB5_9ROSI
MVASLLYFFLRQVFSCWILPHQAYRKIKKNCVSHDIHSIVFPFFAKWQNTHGKLFIHWLGTEPFLYIVEPEFLKKMSSRVLGHGKLDGGTRHSDAKQVDKPNRRRSTRN